MINLFSSPLATRSKALAMIWWCLPEINPGHMWEAKYMNDSLHFSILSYSRSIMIFARSRSSTNGISSLYFSTSARDIIEKLLHEHCGQPA